MTYVCTTQQRKRRREGWNKMSQRDQGKKESHREIKERMRRKRRRHILEVQFYTFLCSHPILSHMQSPTFLGHGSKRSSASLYRLPQVLALSNALPPSFHFYYFFILFWLSCTYICHSCMFLYQSLKKAVGKRPKRLISKKQK